MTEQLIAARKVRVDIRNVSLVFKQGVGHDPAKLIASVKGAVGLF